MSVSSSGLEKEEEEGGRPLSFLHFAPAPRTTTTDQVDRPGRPPGRARTAVRSTPPGQPTPLVGCERGGTGRRARREGAEMVDERSYH